MTARGVRACAVFVVVVLAACFSTSAALGAAGSGGTQTAFSQSHAPGLLWKSFPLAQQPAKAAGSPRRASPASSASPGDTQKPLVLGVLIAVMVSSGLVAIFGVPRRSRVAAAPWRLRRALSGPGTPHGSQPAVARPSAEHDLLEALAPGTRPRVGQRQRVAAGARARPAATPREVVPAREAVERCEITLWRGYVKSQLVARVQTGDVAAVSRHFRPEANEAPTAKAQEALSELLGGLEHSGWRVVETGPAWYERRLERPRTDS
jgi:hypothetical protein